MVKPSFGELMLVVITCAALWSAAMTGNCQAAPKSSDASSLVSAQASLKNLSAVLSKRHIEHIEFFYHPGIIETIVDVRPDDLPKIAAYHLVIAGGLWTETRLSLIDALNKTTLHSFTTNRGYRNFRCGCIFYDLENKQICSIYMDRWGKTAVINGNIVSIDRHLPEWFKRNIGSRLDEL